MNKTKGRGRGPISKGPKAASRPTSNNTKNSTNTSCSRTDSRKPSHVKRERKEKPDILKPEDKLQFTKCKIKVKNVLGRGGFGQVYNVFLIDKPSQTGALKIEPEKTGHRLLFESLLLTHIQHSTGEKSLFPKIYDYGTTIVNNISYRYCLFQILGTNLSDLRLKYGKDGKLLEKPTCAHVSLQTFKSLWDFHELGFGHFDIKPQNFVCGRGSEEERIFLIDYGIGRYCMDNGEFICPPTKYSFAGTPKYCSLNSHRRTHPDQKDDLESWLYMMFEIFSESGLIWSGRDPVPKIQEQKQGLLKNADDVLSKVPEVFTKVADSINTGAYGKKPPHSILYKEMEEHFTKQGWLPCQKVEWIGTQENAEHITIQCDPLDEKALKSLKYDDWDRIAKKAMPKEAFSKVNMSLTNMKQSLKSPKNDDNIEDAVRERK
ncbi:unnamed protein product [Bursaphelenchus okinawaensis]|uniref:non-specific serine/threonine protein kinase n=1 Tax=Bursaphelenchus okinawaensis TaxID=465554 RepID=A0A811KTX1_9BILA|nr:unnamed protein product [Bursaphelenchus okinawaensis]CAG9110592.1 unnamed protein product [Bursaphelenchus okinawaensis]